MADIITFPEDLLKLVPSEGKANTIAGEIIRATSRLQYRFFNDGDMVFWDEGNDTCNAAYRYLETYFENIDTIRSYIDVLRNAAGMPEDYTQAINDLVNKICNYLNSHDELQTTENNTDMWDFYVAGVDDMWDEEEEEDDYDEDDFE